MTWHYKTTDRPGWAGVYSTEQTDNAEEIWNTLVGVHGWTEEATAAVLGNFQVESYINPGQWELYQNYDRQLGMGLGQWTPSTKVSDYVQSTNKDDMANGARQLLLLVNTPGQYTTDYLNPDGTSNYYNESGLPYIANMNDFSHSTASVSDLAKVWAICWERPRNTYYATSKQSRIDHATHWYATFTGTQPSPPSPPDPPSPPTPGYITDELWLAIFMSKMVH